MTTMLGAATAYTNLGIAVFPLVKNSKVPATKDGFYSASTDADAVRKLWEVGPDCNIGGSMGAPSGRIVAIDIDKDEAKGYSGFDFYNQWIAEHGALPETVTAKTGRDGLHLFYRVDREIRPSQNEAIHIDIRGDGGYVVLPPSVHPDTKRRYEWVNSPFEYGFADADEKVYAFIEAVQPHKDSPENTGKIKAPDGQGEGGRNVSLFKLACSLQEQGFSDDAIRLAIQAENTAKCSSPLPQGELNKIIKSALKYDKGTQRETKNVFDHAKFAERLMAECHMCYIDGAPAVWSGECYEIGKSAVERAMIGLKKNIPDRNRREVMKYLEIMAPRREMADKRYIAFSNCVLDITTMETLEMSPELAIANVIPHRWNPEAESLIVDETLTKLACYDVEVMENLIEVIGLCMYRGTEFEKCPILDGTGSNGKSTYINMLHRILGDNNCSSLDIATIGERFQTIPLMGKLANLGDDIANGFIDGGKLAVVKKVVTGDYVSAEYKGGETFFFRPYCTLVFSCNKMPRLGDNSHGMSRRLHPIPFNASFSSRDADFNPNIERDLKTEAAMERAIALGIDGLRRCIERNGLSNNAKSEKLLKEIELESNNVALFASEEFDGSTPEGLEIAKVYEGYRDWCDESGTMAVSRTSFTKAMNGIFGTESTNKKVAKKVVRIFRKA